MESQGDIKFIGIIRVPLANLVFNPGTGEKPYNQKQTDQLERLFRRTSVNHAERRHWIDGYIEQNAEEGLLCDLKLSRSQLGGINSREEYPLVEQQTIAFTQGRHRVDAAKRIDPSSCWTIRLHSTNSHSINIVKCRTEQYQHEITNSDGEIYTKLRGYGGDHVNFCEWHERLSITKQKAFFYIKKRPAVMEALDRLIPLNGVIESLHLSYFLKIFDKRLDDELCAGLDKIHKQWSRITDGRRLDLLDKDTVAALEGRAPSVSRRSAVASTVNLVPSLLSGRTRILIESLNLSSQQHFFAHKWFARISFLEAIVHSGLVLKTGMPRTAQAICGLIAFIIILLLAISSLLWVRKLHMAVFAGVHMIFVLTVIIFLIFHLWLIRPWPDSLASKLPLTIAALAWAAGFAHRHYRSLRSIATIQTLHSASLVTVPLSRPVLVHPGAYFYLHFKGSGLRRLRGEPMVLFDWKPYKPGQGWARNSLYAKELTFLVEDHNMPTLGRDDCELLVEGPYGREIGLHRFSTVLLAAQGTGIAAAMPQVMAIVERYASDSAMRRQMRSQPFERQTLYRDKTSRLNLYWVLTSSADIHWIQGALSRLAAIDETKNILKIWIFDPTNQLAAEIREMNEEQKALFVVLSGTLDFRRKISELASLQPHRSRYVEFDYQPRDGRGGVETVSSKSESAIATDVSVGVAAANDEASGVRAQATLLPPPLKLREASATRGRTADSRREVHVVRTHAHYRSVVGEMGNTSFV
ncbi:hypothetical protein V2A60_003791 [Cordyceps javanica]